MRGGLRRHSPLVAVLSLGAIVRLWTDIEYSALLGPDSWTYVKMAFEGSPVMFAPDRPVGYPLLVEPLTLWGETFALVTLAQHLAGLVIGVLVYFLLLRLDVPRWAATLAAAVVVLDSLAVSLSEQSVMAETLFSLCLTASVFFAATGRRPWALALAGGLLAAAATTRTMALFAIPVFFGYALWAVTPWRARGLAVAGVVVPLVIYSAAQGVSTGYFGLTQSDGWFLYGRVASLMSCNSDKVPPSTRSLCSVSGERGRTLGFDKTAHYVFRRSSPAQKRFGGMYEGDADRRAYVNGQLRDWARAVIRDRTQAYVGGVADDFVNYLRPATAVGDSFLLARPAEPFFAGFTKLLEPAAKAYISDLKARHFPTYRREASSSALLRTYQRWFQFPGRLLLGLSMLALLVVAVALVVRRPLRHTKNILLLLGSSLAILLGAVAASDYQDRFVPSLLPLLVAGSALFGHALVVAVRSRRAARPG